MVDNKQCSDCPDRDDCKSIYQRMGRSQGPNVAFSVTLVFIFPIIIFIIFFAVSERYITDSFSSERAGLALSVLMSAAISIIYAFLLKLTGLASRNKNMQTDMSQDNGSTTTEH